ncbi:unnamed protein product [Bemisia tabaci]|uniref:Sialin n=1 Tax=Bemisia tabaci TaxID=7038 RepID=A0A9P0AKT8_BEMTA|nr:unnamed protein product [Bemisia tabaci]
MVRTSKTDLIVQQRNSSKWKIFKRRRYLVSFLAFFGFINIYALRVNLSVAIVAMTTEHIKIEKLANGTTISKTVQEFNWDSKLRGLILSSFFYGYLCTQMLGGCLSRRFGGARIYGVGVAVTALLTLITPPLTRLNVNFLIALRILEGVFEGVTFPCIHAVWSEWAPPMERTQLASIAFSGCFVGMVVAYPICGFFADVFGWAADFYVTGLLALVWSVIWLWVVRDRPEDDPHISSKELRYIKDSLCGFSTDKEIPVPWRSISTSMPVWSIAVAQFCADWGNFTLLTQLPSFMRDTLSFNLAETGFISALPYVAMALMTQISGFLNDWVRATHLSTTQTRKLFNCSAFTCQAICMFAISYTNTPTGIIFCLIMSCGLGAFACSAFGVNALDIAPQYASLLMGFTNTFSCLPGMISPILAGYLVQHKEAAEWKSVFLITSGVYVFGAVFYGIFADGNIQSWARDDSKPEKSIPQPKDTEKQQPDLGDVTKCTVNLPSSFENSACTVQE